MATSKNKRLTIALFTEILSHASSYPSMVASGVVAAAEKYDVNLLVISGDNISPNPDHDVFMHQRNILFDLVSPENVDGIIVMGFLGNFSTPQEYAEFHRHYHPIPTVSIGTPVPGTISVIPDNEQGLRDAISHLIEVHGRRRIAFVCGLEAAPDAQTRYRVYKQVLQEHNLPFDENLVTPGNFLGASGVAAIHTLLDERKVEFDAIVAANDQMALGALGELQARNIMVPDQVAVVGFDNDGNSMVSIPSLTTVNQPMAGLGERALLALVEKISGQKVPELIHLPTEAVLRQSCGCWEPLIQLAGESPAQASQAALALPMMRQAITHPNLPDAWAQELLDAFQQELAGGEQGPFLAALDGLLRRVANENGNVSEWQGIVSALRHCMGVGLAPEQRTLAENIWHKARVSIQEVARKAQGREYMQLVAQEIVFQAVSQTLVTTIDLQGLVRVIGRELPRLGIQSCYLALYDDVNYPARFPERAHMMLAYHPDAPPFTINERGAPFKTRMLAPAEMLPTSRFTLSIEPLYFQEHQFGFVGFDLSLDGSFYEQLRGQISSALHSARLVEHVEERALQIQTAAEVSHVASTIMEPDALVEQTVELIRRRFNLHYVGLFLVDEENEAGRWAKLRAGTGETGRKMVADGYRLEISPDSSIGWCIANRQSRIVQGASQDAPPIVTHLLPNTHSELVLPLISRGQVIGALTIQSRKENAFHENDVVVMQTMADQLANAIENARLFDQTQQRVVELNKAREAAETARKMAETAKEAMNAEREAAEHAREEAEKARRESEAANRTLAAQMWQTNGQALLNERMRGEQDVPTLATNIIQQLCQYLDLRSGALYVVRNDSLVLTGSYALNARDQAQAQLKLGENTTGQAALERRNILTVIPDDYIRMIYSTSGELLPRNILAAPFSYEGRPIGVIQLSALQPFTDSQLEFVNRAMESVAIAFTTAQARAHVNELYAKTRQQAEELQAQEEELRATNEELEAQTDSLRSSEMKLRENQAELQSANQALAEKARILQLQQDKVDLQNRELEQKAQELAQASKYKSEFLANMSHELRTPLNSMLILAGMLARNDEANLTPDQVESAEVIYAGGNDLLNLINEILDLAKVEAGKMDFHFAPMPWSYLVDRMAAQFNPIAQRKNLTFEIDLDKSLPRQLVTDNQRLAQIVKNLLSNAFKFTESGSITLRIARAAPDVNLSASGLTPSMAVAISIIDTGIGMSPEQQKVVFEAFTQADGSTSRQYGGTGLGLTITREMAHRLGGQVMLSSEVGKGSIFTVYLPLKTAPDDESGEETPAPVVVRQEEPQPGRKLQFKDIQSDAELPPPPIPDDRETISPADRVLLIIEDDQRFAKIVCDYAHKKNFKSLVAGDGETGLALCKKYKPTGIILDIRLPGMSGWDVLNVIKEDPDLRHIPVHFMSAENESLSAYQRGAIGFLTKPVSHGALDGAFDRIENFISNKIRSLLLVEDDPALRLSVRKLLEGSDVVISEAASGRAAIQALRDRHFDCMILDLSLPDISGFDLLKELDHNEGIPKCPIIVYTGKELSPEENQELQKYAESVIVKGVRSPERLQDETALFLHRVIADMPEDKRQTIQKLHNRDSILQDKQVLIVDDDSRNAFALSKLLSEKGIKMHIAPGGAKALEMLEKIDVGLVLTDIMMPGMDGYEFIRALRQKPRFHRTPIIALTAKAMKGDREKCIEAGANDYLSKPIDPDRLISMLRVWLSRES